MFAKYDTNGTIFYVSLLHFAIDSNFLGYFFR